MSTELIENTIGAESYLDPLWPVLADLRDVSRSHIAMVTADDPVLRRTAMTNLRDQINGRFAIFDFDYAQTDLLSLGRYCRTLRADAPICVFAYGLEELKKQDYQKFEDALQFLNAHREDIQYAKAAVVLWLTTDTQNDVFWRAADFADWSTARVNLTLSEEAKELRRKAGRYEKMLSRKNLEQAMVREYERQLVSIRDRLAQIKMTASPQDLDYKYDLFLSHASKDAEWCENLAERLRNEGVRVWFEKWELQPDDDPVARVNEGLKRSHKMVAVFSKSYFRDATAWARAESFAQQSPDILSKDRPLIPLLIEDCVIDPALREVPFLDFREPDDFELRLRQLIESLDLPRRDSRHRDREGAGFDLREHKLDLAERGRHSQIKGKQFEDEVARLYELLGFDVTRNVQVGGTQIDLLTKQKIGGASLECVVECKDTRIAAAERDQILAQQNVLLKEFPRYRWIAVSSLGFAADARAALEKAGIDCVTYNELLNDLVPLDRYVASLRDEYREWINDPKRWNGKNLFIHPNLKADRAKDAIVRKLRPELQTDEEVIGAAIPALEYLGKWLGDQAKNLLVILGDLGTGKTTLAQYIADRLAEIFQSDPQRHPAPVLIPLKDVRKHSSLEGIVAAHFSSKGLSDVKFSRFEQLVKDGKVILIFDAFDEMADRVNWDITSGNFRELVRCADLKGKVVITCRTHYFKDRKEQMLTILGGARSTEIESELYRTISNRPDADVVYLQEFDDEQIKSYLKLVAGEGWERDWQTISDPRNYNLEDLSKRPLLLEMIVKSLPELKRRGTINTANLYQVYTDSWIDREETKERALNREIKERLVFELAWRMWRESKEDRGIYYRDLENFLRPLYQSRQADFGDYKLEQVASEMQLASFLNRDADGNFKFMHKSFMEFFLARKLHEIFTDPTWRGEIYDVLDVRRYDKEMINFLAQLDLNDAMRKPLQAMLVSPYQRNISENALQLIYWSGRCRAGMKDKVEKAEELRDKLADRIPQRAQLATARLQEAVLECADLTEADLAGADLTKANLNYSRLDRAVLRDAGLIEASVENASARDADLQNADLKGASFNQSDLTGSDLTNTRDQSPESFVNASLARVKGLSFSAGIEVGYLRPVVQLGASSRVNAVAVSPDGQCIAAGSDDGVIRLYRMSDGALLRALEGYTNLVRSVAFAPDGETLASGSDDNTVRLWLVKTGELLQRFEGHLGQVSAVAYAPNGRYLVAAGAAGRLQFWDILTGETFLYRYSFGPGAWLDLLPDGRFDASPEGMRYLAYTEDGTLNHYTAESLVKEFYAPEAVREVLEKYTK